MAKKVPIATLQCSLYSDGSVRIDASGEMAEISGIMTAAVAHIARTEGKTPKQIIKRLEKMAEIIEVKEV